MKETLILLMIITYSVLSLDCPKDYCKKADCNKDKVDKEDCESEDGRNGVYRQKGTWCGCCPACLTKLKEGDDCSGTFTRDEPEKVACGPGLKCDIYNFKCIKLN